MKLVQIRDCDGKCCDESPRFPNADRTACLYHVDGGCDLIRDHNKIPDMDCPAYPTLSAVDAFILTCKQFPQNTVARLGKTAGCCYQWVNHGN